MSKNSELNIACAGIDRWRLARTHDAIDVEQRILARHVLVDRKCVADIGADIDVVDVEERQLFVAGLDQQLEILLGDLLAGFRKDFAGFYVDQILGDMMADQFLIGHAQRLETLLGELAEPERTVSFLPASNTTLPLSASTRSLIAL